jgi:DNA/RNA endonuclease YhcR with UshA esterase domain
VAASNCGAQILGGSSACAACGDSCKDSIGNDVIDGSVGCGLGCLLCKKGANIVSYGPMNLKGYWKFDETSGPTAADSSINSNQGAWMNNPTPVPGRVGNALDFNGVNQYVQVSSSNSLNSPDAVTLSAWVFPRSIISGTGSPIIEKYQSYTLFIFSNKVSLYIHGSGSSQFYMGVTDIPLNAWSHIAASHDSSTNIVKFYLNSKLDRTVSTNLGKIVSNSNSLLIGGYFGGGYFNGMIEEARVFGKVLSDEEIKALYDCC